MRHQPLDSPIWGLDRKLASKRFAADLGVRVPEVLSVADSVEGLVLPAVPLVVKPDQGCCGRGVMVSDSGAPVRMVERAAKASAFVPKFVYDQVLPPWFAEERVDARFDWKALAFAGRVVLWRQIDRDRKVSKSWTAGWVDAGDAVVPSKPLDPSLPPPFHPDELTAAAELVSVNLPARFCRIDLFDTAEGVWFGELTPRPGMRPPRRDVDREWGRLWEGS